VSQAGKTAQSNTKPTPSNTPTTKKKKEKESSLDSTSEEESEEAEEESEEEDIFAKLSAQNQALEADDPWAFDVNAAGMCFRFLFSFFSFLFDFMNLSVFVYFAFFFSIHVPFTRFYVLDALFAFSLRS
jgi:hypothetical protein